MVELQGEGGASGRARPTRRQVFFRIRVAFLSLVLLGVLAYAAQDYAARRARRAWERPLHVALVLLERDTLDPFALRLFEERVSALEDVLEREYRRHGGLFRPIRFWLFGPVAEPEPAPLAAQAPSWFEPLRISFSLYRFARRCDAASGLTGAFDGKIYVVLAPPRSSKKALVEGVGQDGGRIALTHIELSEDSVDFGLFVVAHELFHLLGAADRYAPDGSTSIPEGLGDPDRVPLYPQDSLEVMARARVIEPGVEQPPDGLTELRVGPRTAAEIGWRPTP